MFVLSLLYFKPQIDFVTLTNKLRTVAFSSIAPAALVVQPDENENVNNEQ